MKKIKAGFAVRDISPEKPVPGRLGLNHMINPHHPISAKAAAVETGDRIIIIIVCEIVGLTKSVNSQIRDLITAGSGIPNKDIIITGTHTHASPWVWDLQDTEARNQGFTPLDHEWMDKVIKNTAEAGCESIQHMDEYDMRYGKAKTTDIVSNRVHPVTRWSICEDDELRNAPAGEIDPYVRTISFHNKDGKPIFIFSNLNVHPTAFGGGRTEKVSPDFPYIAELKLRKKFNNSLTLAYWQGCGGNSNSGKYVKKGSDAEVEVIGNNLSDAIENAVKSAKILEPNFEYRYTKFKLPVGDFVAPVDIARRAFVEKCEGIRAGNDSHEDIFHWRKKLKQLDVSLLSQDGGMEIEFQLLKFLNTDILFVPGEWFVQLYKNLSAKKPERNLIVTTLNNFDLLYVPDEASMPNKEWYGVRTGMRSLGNQSAIDLYNEAVEFLD